MVEGRSRVVSGGSDHLVMIWWVDARAGHILACIPCMRQCAQCLCAMGLSGTQLNSPPFNPPICMHTYPSIRDGEGQMCHMMRDHDAAISCLDISQVRKRDQHFACRTLSRQQQGT